MLLSSIVIVVKADRAVRIELFSSLEYSIDLLFEYSSIRLIPEVAINHMVVKIKRHMVYYSGFYFLVQQRFEVSQTNARNYS